MIARTRFRPFHRLRMGGASRRGRGWLFSLAFSLGSLLLLAATLPLGSLAPLLRPAPAAQSRSGEDALLPRAQEGSARATEQVRVAPVCGDGRCDDGENLSCADCPGISTAAQCGEEPHSDPGGEAVAWGITHRARSAGECCDRCAEHAAVHPEKPYAASLVI